MRIPAVLIVSGAALFAFPAAAQQFDTASQRLEIVGDAPTACVLNAPTAANAVNSTFGVTGLASGRVNIAQFVDPGTATSNASSIDLNFPVICNAPHRVIMRSSNGGMLRAGAVAGGASRGFIEFTPYNLSLNWAGQSLNRSSDAGTGTIDSSEAGSGDLNLRIATPAGSGPFVAGTYTDIIVIELQPAN